MARKRTPSPVSTPVEPARPSITAERFVRLYKLLQLLSAGPQTRAVLTEHLGLDVRGFYRDLEVLRLAGIPVRIENGRYHLDEDAATATARLPYPDPGLTFGEMLQLARGKSTLHTRLREQIEGLTN